MKRRRIPPASSDGFSRDNGWFSISPRLSSAPAPNPALPRRGTPPATRPAAPGRSDRMRPPSLSSSGPANRAGAKSFFVLPFPHVKGKNPQKSKKFQN